MIGIRTLLEQIALDCFNNPFLTDAGTPENNIPPLDELDEGETVYIFCSLYFFSSSSTYVAARTMYDITLNSSLSISYTSVTSTIGSQYTAEREEARERGIYNRLDRGYCSRRFSNGNICPKRSLLFFNGCAGF